LAKLLMAAMQQGGVQQSSEACSERFTCYRRT
jgi:hypothetical protein